MRCFQPLCGFCLQAYRAESGPVEAFFRAQGLLLDFEITGGIPETLPRLLETLAPHMPPAVRASIEEQQQVRATA